MKLKFVIYSDVEQFGGILKKSDELHILRFRKFVTSDKYIKGLFVSKIYVLD